MENVTTATGKTFRTDMVSVIRSPERLYIRVVEMPMAQVATVFSDKKETMTIRYGSEVLSRWTRLIALVPEQNAVKVILGKE